MFANGSGLDTASPTAVLCPVSRDVGGEEFEKDPVEDSESEMTLVLEHWVCDSKTGIENFLREGAGRSHVRNGGYGESPCHRRKVPEGPTTEARKHEIAAFEEKRRQSRDDDTTESGTNADLKSSAWREASPTCLGYPRHASRILPRASARRDLCSHATRSLYAGACGPVATSFVRHATGELAVAESSRSRPEGA